MVSAEGCKQFSTHEAVLVALSEASQDATGQQMKELIKAIQTSDKFADLLSWAYIEIAWGEVAELDNATRDGVGDPIMPVMVSRLLRADFEQTPNQLAETRPQSDETVSSLYTAWADAETDRMTEGSMRAFTASKLRTFVADGMAVVNTDTGKEQACLKLVSRRIRKTESGDFREVVLIPVSTILQKATRGGAAIRLANMLHKWGSNISSMRRINDQCAQEGKHGFDCLPSAKRPESRQEKVEIIQTDTAKYTIGLFG